MTQYRQVPVFEQKILDEEHTNAQWYRYFQSHDTGQPPGAEKTITVTASPFVYTAPRKGFVIITGGTVTSILFSRSGTYYNTGVASGSLSVAQGDMLKVAYTVVPTMVFVPT